MATQRSLVCRCKTPKHPSSLFGVLFTRATRADHAVCETCSGPQRLWLTFDFALGAGSRTCEVLAAFLPQRRASWPDDGGKITFHPFLVVLRQGNGKRTYWLPYWHEVEKRGEVRLKYGQWAPYMDERLFVSLIGKARRAGYLRQS
jgi:hypothetical protein